MTIFPDPHSPIPDARPVEVPRADYLLWAKRRPHPANDLGRSDVIGCTLDDVPGMRESLALAGRNDEGWPPLVDGIAAHYGVEPAGVATATGTSGANFLVCAALLQPGDDVVVEQPAYDPLLAVPRLLGANLVRFERRFEDGFRLDLDRVAAAITPAHAPHHRHQSPQPDRRAVGHRRDAGAGRTGGAARLLRAGGRDLSRRGPGAAPAGRGDALAAHHHDEQPDQGVRPGRPALRLGPGDAAPRRGDSPGAGPRGRIGVDPHRAGGGGGLRPSAGARGAGARDPRAELRGLRAVHGRAVETRVGEAGRRDRRVPAPDGRCVGRRVRGAPAPRVRDRRRARAVLRGPGAPAHRARDRRPGACPRPRRHRPRSLNRGPHLHLLTLVIPPARQGRQEKKKSSQQEFEHASDRNAHDSEGQRQQPDERIGNQREQRQRPAQHEENQPEQELHHAALLIGSTVTSAARVLFFFFFFFFFFSLPPPPSFFFPPFIAAVLQAGSRSPSWPSRIA